jgi:hypothetical protein
MGLIKREIPLEKQGKAVCCDDRFTAGLLDLKTMLSTWNPSLAGYTWALVTFI